MTKEIIKSPFKILFVDDEEGTRKYFEKGLKNFFNIFTAANVEEAQKIIYENHRDIAVVLTDQRMPGGNGIKLLRFLRTEYPQIIRLLTTAYSDLTEAIEAVNSGEILRYIQKPWDFSMLKHELKQAEELFELRLERNNFLHEKIVMRRKMSKVDRVRSLLVFAKSLNFIRFSESSMTNFINHFAIDSATDSDDWNELDFGNYEVCETKFFLTLIAKVQEAFSPKDVDDFDCDLSDFFKMLEEARSDQDIQLQSFELPQIKVNRQTFQKVVKKIFEISSCLKAKQISISANGDAINLTLRQITWPKNSDLFVTNPKKLESDLQIDLLICYLLAGHNGMIIDVTADDQNHDCTISLSFNSKQNLLRDKDAIDNETENSILSAMLA